jgi:hypothetical protein
LASLFVFCPDIVVRHLLASGKVVEILKEWSARPSPATSGLARNNFQMVVSPVVV